MGVGEYRKAYHYGWETNVTSNIIHACAYGLSIYIYRRHPPLPPLLSSLCLSPTTPESSTLSFLSFSSQLPHSSYFSITPSLSHRNEYSLSNNNCGIYKLISIFFELVNSFGIYLSIVSTHFVRLTTVGIVVIKGCFIEPKLPCNDISIVERNTCTNVNVFSNSNLNKRGGE